MGPYCIASLSLVKMPTPFWLNRPSSNEVVAGWLAKTSNSAPLVGGYMPDRPIERRIDMDGGGKGRTERYRL